jgi:hypothetical protein
VRFTIRERVDAVPAELDACIGANIPLRIGPMGWTSYLESVERDGDDLVITFDLPDADVRWEALTARRSART